VAVRRAEESAAAARAAEGRREDAVAAQSDAEEAQRAAEVARRAAEEAHRARESALEEEVATLCRDKEALASEKERLAALLARAEACIGEAAPPTDVACDRCPELQAAAEARLAPCERCPELDESVAALRERGEAARAQVVAMALRLREEEETVAALRAEAAARSSAEAGALTADEAGGGAGSSGGEHGEAAEEELASLAGELAQELAALKLSHAKQMRAAQAELRKALGGGGGGSGSGDGAAMRVLHEREVQRLQLEIRRLQSSDERQTESAVRQSLQDIHGSLLLLLQDMRSLSPVEPPPPAPAPVASRSASDGLDPMGELAAIREAIEQLRVTRRHLEEHLRGAAAPSWLLRGYQSYRLLSDSCMPSPAPRRAPVARSASLPVSQPARLPSSRLYGARTSATQLFGSLSGSARDLAAG